MTWPMRLTLLRIFLVPLILISILYRRDETPLVAYFPAILFIVAALTDAIDGYLARRNNQISDIGRFLDPFADKTLILSILICLQFAPAYAIRMPIWVLIIIAARDFIIIMGLITAYATHITINPKPNILGKITTVSQMALIGSLLLELPQAPFFWYSTLLFTLSSTINYIWRETRHLKQPA